MEPMQGEGRLQIGDTIRTSYGTGPYRVIAIRRGCTCPRYDDWLLACGDGATPSAPHLHLTCVGSATPVRKRYGEGELRWLNGFSEGDDGRFVSVWTDDEIFVVTRHGSAATRFYEGLLGTPDCPSPR